MSIADGCCRSIELTIPDSETFIPEFGLCLPPELTTDFDDINGIPFPDHGHNEIELDVNISDPLQIPLERTHDFSLPGYERLSIGHDSNNNSGFGDFSDGGGGGFGNDYDYDEEDDILRNANNAGQLDFNLDPPSTTRKRTAEYGNGDASKRARHTTSIDDDDIQRIAREDHDNGRQLQQTEFDQDTGGFGDLGFDEYRTPPPLNDDPEAERVQDVAPRAKKRRRIVIVEDSFSTIKDAEYRTWPQKYYEIQAARNARRKAIEMSKLAKERATNYLWGFNGRESSSLHPLLNELFSRAVLLERWKGRKTPAAPLADKRKRDDEEMEFGMGDTGGFGGGGFDSIDFSVLHP